MKNMDTPPASNMVSLAIEGSQANLTLTRPDKFNAIFGAKLVSFYFYFHPYGQRDRRVFCVQVEKERDAIMARVRSVSDAVIELRQVFN